MRIYGFNNVPIPEKLNTSITTFPKPDLEKTHNTIADLLVDKGFVEVMNNSLTKNSYYSSNQEDNNSVSILNPLSQELGIMRKSLLFGILENLQYNQNRQQSNLKVFEFGKTYQKLEKGYSESKQLILAISGRKHLERWNSGNEQVDYFSLKGYVDALFTRLGLMKHISFDSMNSDYYSEGQTLKIQGKLVGELGILNSTLLKQIDLKQPVYAAIIQWDTVVDLLKLNAIKYQEIPKTFAVRRDFSLLLNKEITFDQVAQSAKKVEKKLLKSVELFDVYQGKNLEEGKKSYAVSFHFQDNESTLTDHTVDQIMDKIKKSLETDISAQLR